MVFGVVSTIGKEIDLSGREKMDLVKIGFAIVAIVAGAAWLNVWAMPRRTTDVSGEVSVKIVFLGFAGLIGVALILIGFASFII